MNQWKAERWQELNENDNNNVVIVLVDDKQELKDCEGEQQNDTIHQQPNIIYSSSSCDIPNSCSRDLIFTNSLNDEQNYDEDYDNKSNLEAINADDSGGGSYEDSNPMQGSQRNSLEKDDDYDEDEIDVISTDVSCYDTIVINRNDDVTIVIADDLIKVNSGDGIYTNPFVGW